MAFDINSFVNKKTTNNSGFNVDSFLQKKGFNKPDLTQSEGLYQTAQGAGGLVAGKADSILNPEQTLWGRVKLGSRKMLGTTLDVLQRPNFAIASAVRNEIDNDPNTDFVSGLKSGITGRTKHTFSDVFEEAGWNPETRAGKIAKGSAGFALDVLLDPTTYITFGVGPGAKVGAKVLSKTGTKFAAKAAAQGIGAKFGEDFIKKSVVAMAEKSPELYGKFLDKGGIKFFGTTLISSGRIAGVAKAIPGMTKLDEATLPLRNSIHALFNRDVSATYGKLTAEEVALKQKFIDLSANKISEDVEEVVRIAQANKLTTQEADIITNAIEYNHHLADDRLENSKHLFEHVMGRNLKNELKAGIPINERPNYVPHMLMETDTKAIPFKPEGVRVSLGASKSRTIQKFISETGEEVVGKADKLGLKKVDNIRGLSQQISSGEFRSIKDIEKTLGKYGVKLRFKPQEALRGKYGGYFDPTKKEIVIASKQGTLDEVLNVVDHEITHNAHFQIAGDIQMMETFTGRGLSKKLADKLDNAKSAARSEFENILRASGVDPKKLNATAKAYYKKPTELLAYSMQAYLRDPKVAAMDYPKTVAALKELQASHPLFKLVGKEVDRSGGILGKQIFQDASGKLFSTTSAQQATIKEINEAFGKEFFDANIINNVAARSAASARAVAAADFMREAAQKLGATADNAPSNYVKVGAKELEGILFHPRFAEQIDGFKKALINDEATNILLKRFDQAQNIWKASVTSIFPAFHGRNAISNVFLNFLDIGLQSLNPTKHLLAGELLNMNRQANALEKAALGTGKKAVSAKAELETLMKKSVLKEDSGKAWTFGDLRKTIKETRVAFSNDFTGFLDIRETIKDKLGKATKASETMGKVGREINPISQNNRAFKIGRKVAQTVEEQARLVNFLTNLQKTGDVTTAAARTKQFLFDYTNLSPFEKTFMRRIVPFYTFTRKNLELQVTQMLKQPGKFATQAKLFTQLSKSLSGATLTDEEKKALPDWIQGGLGLVISKDGPNVEIINSLGTPIEALFSSIQPNSILGSLTPIAAVPLQAAIGKHFFFDRDLKEVDNAEAFKNAPQFIKDYIGYTERTNKDGSTRGIALNPTRMFIIQNIPPSSRIVSVIGQLEDENVSGKLKLLRQTTGLKPYGKNLDTEALYREKQKIRELQDLLDASGVAPIFQRSFIPKEKSPYLPDKYKDLK